MPPTEYREPYVAGYRNGRRGFILLLLMPPATHTITVKLSKQHFHGEVNQYTLAFPSLVYGLYVDRYTEAIPISYLWSTNTSLLCGTSPLYATSLPNIHSNGLLCQHHNWGKRSVTLFQYIQNAVNILWESRFNLDVTATISPTHTVYSTTAEHFFRKWEDTGVYPAQGTPITYARSLFPEGQGGDNSTFGKLCRNALITPSYLPLTHPSLHIRLRSLPPSAPLETISDAQDA